jgi:hypothetical protein
MVVENRRRTELQKQVREHVEAGAAIFTDELPSYRVWMLSTITLLSITRHLFRYIDEQAFRYNNRKDMNDADRFSLAVSQIIGKGSPTRRWLAR